MRANASGVFFHLQVDPNKLADISDCKIFLSTNGISPTPTWWHRKMRRLFSLHIPDDPLISNAAIHTTCNSSLD
jgi:hypothetical protein